MKESHIGTHTLPIMVIAQQDGKRPVELMESYLQVPVIGCPVDKGYTVELDVDAVKPILAQELREMADYLDAQAFEDEHPKTDQGPDGVEESACRLRCGSRTSR